MFRFHIVNDLTITTIDTALQRKGEKIEEWPGTTFDMTTDEGKAILATPNGAGVAWWLIDHKSQLGVKTVKSVTVFKGRGIGKDWYNAVFEIEPSSVKGKGKGKAG